MTEHCWHPFTHKAEGDSFMAHVHFCCMGLCKDVLVTPRPIKAKAHGVLYAPVMTWRGLPTITLGLRNDAGVS